MYEVCDISFLGLYYNNDCSPAFLNHLYYFFLLSVWALIALQRSWMTSRLGTFNPFAFARLSGVPKMTSTSMG